MLVLKGGLVLVRPPYLGFFVCSFGGPSKCAKGCQVRPSQLKCKLPPYGNSLPKSGFACSDRFPKYVPGKSNNNVTRMRILKLGKFPKSVRKSKCRDGFPKVVRTLRLNSTSSTLHAHFYPRPPLYGSSGLGERVYHPKHLDP